VSWPYTCVTQALAGDPVVGPWGCEPLLVPAGVGLAALVLTAPLVAAPASVLGGALPTAPLALHAASAATLAAAAAHASRRARR
jgi:hypothetical protein